MLLDASSQSSTRRAGEWPQDRSRRSFLGGLASLPALAVLAPLRALSANEERLLSFVHTHTSERLVLPYFARGSYLTDSLSRMDQFLRDHRTGEVHAIDPALFDLLHDLRSATNAKAPFQVISCYRSPATNRKLRSADRGVAKGSLHLEGRAIDVRVSDVSTAVLREAAKELGRGGVGYYRESDFVHVDTGRVRFW